MKLETLYKPLDYDAEGRKTLEETHNPTPGPKADSYTSLFYDLLTDVPDDDKAAVDAIYTKASGINKMFAESESIAPWTAADIGKAFINTPSKDKLLAEQQELYMEPLEPDVFYEISDDVDPVDSEMQAKLEEMAARLENMF